VLTLDCGHTLNQKRSPSYLKKEQFKTLKTEKGRPLRAHCDICKQSPGASTMQESISKINECLATADREFDSIFGGMAGVFMTLNGDADGYRQLGELKSKFEIKRKALRAMRDGLASANDVIERLNKEGN